MVEQTAPSEDGDPRSEAGVSGVPGRRRTVPEARCRNSLHHNAKITSNGTYWRGGHHYRAYRCEPVSGRSHIFSVRIDERPGAVWSPPPPCPKHPGSHVIRKGTYGRRGHALRQRYHCTPADGSVPHHFTPPLPRDHVHARGVPCAVCGEHRGVHRGETAVARQHRWSARVVAEGLAQLSAGVSYGEVGRWALRVAGISIFDQRRASPPPKPEPDSLNAPKKRRVSAASKASHRVWHIGADWVEAFSPVIWGPIEARLREGALVERARLDAAIAAHEPLERPQIILLDDVPVYGQDPDKPGHQRRDAGFFVLVVAEIAWHEGEREQKLRLVRAMPKSNTDAWRLCFDELGYDPDFVVADAGTGIGAAIATHFDPERTRFVPSLWHVAKTVRAALAKTPGAASKGQLRPELATHLAELGRDGRAMRSPGDWLDWWNDLEGLLRAAHLPVDVVRRRRANYEQAILTVLPDLLANPAIPMSTGGLEKTIATRIERVLNERRAQLANIERTNALFDLVVAREHGAFDHPDEVAALLRTDARAHEGWTVSLRAIADPYPSGGRYSSLRDPTLLASLARERGVA